MERLDHIKLIVSDLDGTLLNDNKQLDSEICSLLPMMRDKGIEFTVATGRNMHIMQEFVSTLKIDIPYITNNGANMFKGKKCIYECRILTSDLLFSLKYLKDVNIPILVYSNVAIYPIGSHPQLSVFMKRLEGKCDILKEVSIQEIVNESIFKVVIIHDDENRMKEIMNVINQNCKYAHCVRSEGNIYTLTHIDATKGKTLKKLLEHMQISEEEVLVFGDNFNDQSMFNVAKYSVAMGNASDEIKRSTNFVSKSNQDNGVSTYIKNNVLSHL